MPIEITSHHVEGSTGNVRIEVLDGKGPGGAHCVYGMHSPTAEPLDEYENYLGGVNFQKGCIGSEGMNGITNEALLAIVAHRLECFQAGPYSCNQNGTALHLVKGALAILKVRTMERIGRGVLGKEEL